MSNKDNKKPFSPAAIPGEQTMSAQFTEFMIQCLRAEECQLRKFIKRVLPRYGFDTIKEDDYVSERVKHSDRYKSVHNLIALRGKDPKICLVAHTDVCRDHKVMDDDPIYYGDPAKRPTGARMVEPVIKDATIEEGEANVIRKVIQDRTQSTQVGGDDRVGVAINLWIALNTGYDMALYFPTDEEIGLQSAKKVNFPEFAKFDLCVEVDRGNSSHELVNKISGLSLCDYDTTARLLSIAYDMGRSRALVTGRGTDVYQLKERKLIKNAVNMTCGYHASNSASGLEYIDIEEARSTMQYVAAIVRDYQANEDE